MKFIPYTIVIFLFVGCSTSSKKINFSESDFGSQNVKFVQADGDINFFISKETDKKLPLILLIQGSGCGSLFVKDRKGLVHTTSLFGLVGPQFKNRAHMMAVEKPGVPLFSDPNQSGQAVNCSDDFKKMFTMTNWVHILKKHLDFASKLPFIDSQRIIVIGHSEGGEAAAYLSEKHEGITDVIALSLGGTGQLYDFITFAQKDALSKKKSPANAVQGVISDFKKIKQSAQSSNNFEWGHTYLYWADKFSLRPHESLKKSNARIFLAQGSADRATPIEAFDFLISDLLTAGKDFKFLRVDGADHDFSTKLKSDVEGFTSVFKDVDNWLSI